MLTGCLNSLVEDGSQGDGRGLDGGEVCRDIVSATCASARGDGGSRGNQDTISGCQMDSDQGPRSIRTLTVQRHDGFIRLLCLFWLQDRLDRWTRCQAGLRVTMYWIVQREGTRTERRADWLLNRLVQGVRP